jgi:hypothetical protein
MCVCHFNAIYLPECWKCETPQRMAVAMDVTV